MKYMTNTYLALVFSLISLSLLGQHKESSQHANNNEHKGTSRLTVGLGHTHLSEGKIDGKTEWLALPSWSLNYDYWFANKWAIGLQNDVILESFFIETGDDEILERSYPVASVPVLLYKPGKRLMIMAGVGAEFTHEKTLTLTRLGLEYGFHLPNKWELGAALVWDNKWNYYNSWGLAITISKLFNKH
jgi:hypothetical protein